MKTVASQSGRVSKSVNVSTDAPGAANLRLRFSVDVRRPIEARPSLRLILNTIEGTSSSQKILLSRADGQTLVVRDPRSPLEGVSVAVHPVVSEAVQTAADDAETPTPWGAAATPAPPDDGHPGDVWLEMKTTTSLAAGRYSGSLDLATNDPESPKLEVPFTIRVRPLIDARPAVVRMWMAPNPSDQGGSVIVTLNHSGGRAFRIVAVDVSNPEIFTATAYGDKASMQQSLRIALIDGLETAEVGPGVEGWVRIATDDPERPLIEVPVLVAPTQALSRRPVTAPR
jgi:hypothetical protein